MYKGLDSIPKIDFFEFVDRKTEAYNDRATQYPFQFATKQFLLDHVQKGKAMDFNAIAKTMFDYWNTNKNSPNLPKEVQAGVKAACIKHKLGDTANYNGFLFYLASKYINTIVREDFITFVLTSGIDALKARQDDLDDYLTNMKYCITNHYKEDETYVQGLISRTEYLVDFYTFNKLDFVV